MLPKINRTEEKVCCRSIPAQIAVRVPGAVAAVKPGIPGKNARGNGLTSNATTDATYCSVKGDDPLRGL